MCINATNEGNLMMLN